MPQFDLRHFLYAFYIELYDMDGYPCSKPTFSPAEGVGLSGLKRRRCFHHVPEKEDYADVDCKTKGQQEGCNPLVLGNCIYSLPVVSGYPYLGSQEQNIEQIGAKQDCYVGEGIADYHIVDGFN
jgi:hypothetical protein